MKYKKNLSEPWFSFIRLGLKTVEGRLRKGDFGDMKEGDIICFENLEEGYERSFEVTIVGIEKYETFRQYLEVEGMKNCLPGIETIEDGVKIYHKYYSEEEERKYQIIAIKIILN